MSPIEEGGFTGGRMPSVPPINTPPATAEQQLPPEDAEGMVAAEVERRVASSQGGTPDVASITGKGVGIVIGIANRAAAAHPSTPTGGEVVIPAGNYNEKGERT